MKMATTISSLCDEIMMDILSRLLVQDLSSCRFVCKSWFSFIKDPAFVDLHHSRLDQHDPTFIIIHLKIEPRREIWAPEGFAKTGKKEVFLVDNKNTTTSPMAKSISAYIPTSYFGQSWIVCSCNGLLCLRSPLSRQSYLIVNPITKEMLHLPEAPKVGVSNFWSGYCEIGPLGFAFDETTKTYKVVQTWCFQPDGKIPVLFIDMHTIGSGKWMRREFLDACGSGEKSVAFVNNALHWQIRDRQSTCHICAFDVGAGTITRFKIPPKDKDAHYQSLGIIKGCLASFTEIHGELTVWVMKDYGVDESWTKQCTVCLNRATISKFHPYWEEFKTLRTMKNGSTLVSDGERLSYFEIDKKKLQVINIQGFPSYKIDGFSVVVAHVGSLVSPKSIVAGNEITSAMPNDDWKEVSGTDTGLGGTDNNDVSDDDLWL